MHSVIKPGSKYFDHFLLVGFFLFILTIGDGNTMAEKTQQTCRIRVNSGLNKDM